MSKKSALTAALSGGPAAPASTQPPRRSRAFLDPAAFPCIVYAEELDGGHSKTTPSSIPAVPEEEFEPTNVVIVGSAPTNVLSSKGVLMADPPLNPRRRRGGQEYTADYGASLDERNGTTFPASASLSSNFLSDAVIGSLPKGLSNAEKMKILQSSTLSPSRALLQEMSAVAVSSRTMDGRTMRRQVLKGAVIVFVTAGYSGKRFIFEKAKQLGVRSVVLDGPDSWVQLLVEEGIIEKFVPIDFSDADTVYDRCLQACKKAQSEVGELDGITTFCEIAVPLASRLAEQLGLPGNSPAAVDNARDKHATRSLMHSAGLPTPKHFKISAPEHVAQAAEHVGFPAVIKPISGAASIGVMRVNDLAQLQTAYKRVLHDMSRARIVAGALIEGSEEGTDAGNAGSWIQLVLMLEEYLDGDEVDCDLIFCEGQPVFGAITDNWPTVEPYFNETGSNCPSILPKATQVELMELSVRAVQALGFKLGVFHVECKATTRGPRLIEVNCRMGGGPVRDTNLLVWGVDLVEENLMAFAGIPVRPPIPKRPLMYIAEYSINAKITGTLEHDKFLDYLQGRPEILYARPLVQTGARCVCVEDGLPTWVAELMVSCPTVHEAIELAKKLEQEIQIPIIPSKN